MEDFIGTLGSVALLLAVGGLLGTSGRTGFSARWLLVAAALIVLDDTLLTRGHGTIPNVLPHAHWNWQGKVLALAATLAIAALPAFGWRRSGLTLRQEPGTLPSAAGVALIYCLFFLGIALAFPDTGHASGETVAFQLSMPGFEEEPFYRGILLLALDRAFTARVRFLGVDWGWGAVLSCMLFGLAHALDYGDHGFTFDPLTMVLTALPSFIAVWLRLRTGSVVLPVVLHNFGNAIGLVV